MSPPPDRIARLQDVTAALSEALTPEQVAEVVVAHAIPAVGACAGSVFVPSEDGRTLVLAGARGYREDVIAAFRTMPIDTRVPIAEAARRREPLWLQSLADWDRFTQAPPESLRAHGHAAWAVLPLLAEGGLLGVMGLSFERPHSFDDDDRRMAMTLARQCAQALLRARLYREVQRARARAERHAERSSRLLAVASDLAQALTPAEVASAVLDHGVAALTADTGAIWLLEQARTSLCLLHAVGYPQTDRLARIELDPATPVGEAVGSGRPLFLTTGAEYAARYPAAEARDRQQLGRAVAAVACLPLMAEGRIHGSLALTFAEARGFDPDDRAFLVLLANQAAQALERARRLDAERRERERLAFLADAGTALSASLDYQATLAAVARLAVDQGLADWCVVEIVDERTGARQQVAVAHKDPAKVELARELRRRFPPDPEQARGLSAVLRTGRPELVLEVTPELLAAHARDPAHLELLRTLGLHSVMIVPMTTPDRVFGAITFIHAESGRGYGEADLELAEELARRAAMAVENARLYAAAQRAITARDDTLAIVSHDLKNPLGIVTMQAELLARDEALTPDRVRAAAARIQRAGDRMQRLISDLLDMASLDEGSLHLDLEPIGLATLLQDAVDVHAPVAAAARVQLVTGTVIDARVRCDRDRLLRVLANLLANAVRHTPAGGSIQVSGRPVGQEAHIEVRDTGSGIAAEDLERVFDRFWRAHGHGKGTGLGLAISRGLVEAHGGRIWVDSTPGAGSVFTFTLPLVEPVAAAV